jgi:hypothetical protein
MGARLALRRRPVAPRLEVRAQDELALKTARFQTAVRLGDLIERDPLGDARPDGANRRLRRIGADWQPSHAGRKAVERKKEDCLAAVSRIA